MEVGHPSELVDLARYPIADLQSPAARELIAYCRDHLQSTGCCVLPNFVKAEAVQKMVRESEALVPQTYWSTVVGNAYLEPEDKTLPADNPRNMTEATKLGALAYDQIPTTDAIRRLYEWDGLMNFLAGALGKEQLYRYADPMGALNVAVMKDGDYLRWHFDQTDFVTSITLQDADEGGDFECVPLIRNPNSENYDRVRSVLQGDRQGVVKVELNPGALVLFQGRYTLHRVTPIQGKTLRLVALLGYDTQPGVVSSEHLRYMRYGRTVK